MSSVVLSKARRTRPPAIPLVQRAPLVLPTPGLERYADTLPWVPPLTRDYLRGDMWGITMPGAPWVPGACSDILADGTKTWERILSWFLDRYPLPFQLAYLAKTASYGYTHVLLSYGDSCGPVDNGPQSPPGNARTLEQFIETCWLVKSITSARDSLPLSVAIWLGSKYFHPSNMTLAQFQDYFGPVLEQLFAAHAIDEIMPGAEWNLWQDPNQTIPIFKWVGQWAHQQHVTTWFHGSPHYVWWGPDGTDRFAFWENLGADCDGVNYQTDPAWTADEVQARAVDSLWAFGVAGNQHKFRIFEDTAAYQWSGRPLPPTMIPADEAQGVARGYTNSCTVDNVRGSDAVVWGYGNGGSMPDGTVL